MSTSELPLAGRTILVTGGAHRVGGAISRHLGDRGARIVVHFHRSAGEATDLAGLLPAGSLAVGSDLGAADGPRRLLDACAAADRLPDAVVHAAASFLAQPFLATTAEDWDAVQALNVRAFFLLSQEMARRRGTLGGDLVVIGDAAALELWPGYLAHSVAKAALIPLVKALAKSLAPDFRINGVIPGPVLPPQGASAAEIDRMRQRTLLKRLGDPADVALAVEFLLRCRFATGSWIEVTGGSQLWRGQLAPPGGAADPAGEELLPPADSAAAPAGERGLHPPPGSAAGPAREPGSAAEPAGKRSA